MSPTLYTGPKDPLKIHIIANQVAHFIHLGHIRLTGSLHPLPTNILANPSPTHRQASTKTRNSPSTLIDASRILVLLAPRDLLAWRVADP